MAKLSFTEEKQALTNFLKTISKNENLSIETPTERIGNKKFKLIEKLESGTIVSKSNLMTYEEMNCFFFGVLAVKENRVIF